MKKILLALVLAVSCAAPLFADDIEDVKATVVRMLEKSKKGDLRGMLDCFAPDYGSPVTVGELRTMLPLLDGEHLEEFLVFGYKMGNNGKNPPDAEMAEIKKALKDPGVIQTYKEVCAKFGETEKQFAAKVSAGMPLVLKSIKFSEIKVDGDKAEATLEYDEKMPADAAPKHVREIVELKKLDGA